MKELKLSDLNSIVSLVEWCKENIYSVEKRLAKKNTNQIKITEAKKILNFFLDNLRGGDKKAFVLEINKLIERLEKYEKDEKKFVP